MGLVALDQSFDLGQTGIRAPGAVFKQQLYLAPRNHILFFVESLRDRVALGSSLRGDRPGIRKHHADLDRILARTQAAAESSTL